MQPLNTLRGVLRQSVRRLETLPITYRTNWTLGQGNCMFAAFAVGCRFEMGQHREMRRAAVRRMKERPEDFRPFVTDGSYEHYLAEMSKDRTWGDNLALQAMCAAYRAFVLVLKEEPNGAQVWMEVGDRSLRSSRQVGVLCVSES